KLGSAVAGYRDCPAGMSLTCIAGRSHLEVFTARRVAMLNQDGDVASHIAGQLVAYPPDVIPADLGPALVGVEAHPVQHARQIGMSLAHQHTKLKRVGDLQLVVDAGETHQPLAHIALSRYYCHRPLLERHPAAKEIRERL